MKNLTLGLKSWTILIAIVGATFGPVQLKVLGSVIPELPGWAMSLIMGTAMLSYPLFVTGAMSEEKESGMRDVLLIYGVSRKIYYMSYLAYSKSYKIKLLI
jgi:hypothetical protein